MNKVEQFCYNILKRNQWLKNCVRNIYQSIFDLLPDKANYFVNAPIVLKDCYFGFHDRTPFSKDNLRILSNKLVIPLRMPTVSDELIVGFWSGENYTCWNEIGRTLAWNYHKGCRLQWVDEERIIYNIYVNNRLCSNICNLKTLKETIIDYPVDSVCESGRFATTFSYGRLQKMMPGYGYNFDDDSYLEEKFPYRTGLFLIDLDSNTCNLLVSLEELALFKAEESMKDSYHFVTHSLFSPDGHYISFLHRWYHGNERNTRLVVYDIEKQEMFISPTDGMVSHYVWNAKNEIIAYCRINSIDCHVHFGNPQMTNFHVVGYPTLNSDGHQSFLSDEVFITDTYPDRRRYSKLYLVDVRNDLVVKIADIKSPKKFQSKSESLHWCCDLHPRCSRDGKLVSFDSVHNGYRSLCVMKLSID